MCLCSFEETMMIWTSRVSLIHASLSWSKILVWELHFAVICTRSDVWQFGKSGDCRRASPLRDIPNGAHRQWDLLGHVHRVCCRVWSACFFRGLYTPSVSDRWAVEGVHGNYYAITHKPIDLDWTPGGRAARSRARPDLLQDQVRKCSAFTTRFLCP